METKKYGSVTFDEQGLVIEKEYNKETCSRYIDFDRILECAKDYIQGRMAHCLNQLEDNVDKIIWSSPYLAVWKDGHFSRAAYDTMATIEKVKHWKHLDEFQLEQIIKALHFNKPISNKEWPEEIKSLTFNMALCNLHAK